MKTAARKSNFSGHLEPEPPTRSGPGGALARGAGQAGNLLTYSTIVVLYMYNMMNRLYMYCQGCIVYSL